MQIEWRGKPLGFCWLILLASSGQARFVNLCTSVYLPLASSELLQWAAALNVRSHRTSVPRQPEEKRRCVYICFLRWFAVICLWIHIIFMHMAMRQPNNISKLTKINALDYIIIEKSRIVIARLIHTMNKPTLKFPFMLYDRFITNW